MKRKLTPENETEKLRDETPQPTPKPIPEPETDVPEDMEESTEQETVEETTEKTESKPRKTWIENFGVKEVVDVEEIDRLTVKVGVNEYKGNHLVFIAKVTDKEFSRQFFSMPAYLWEKAIIELQKVIPKVAQVEKQTMSTNIEKELLRLKELGIDIGAIARKVAKGTT